LKIVICGAARCYRKPLQFEEFGLLRVVEQEFDCPHPEQLHPADFDENCLYKVRPTKNAAMAMIVKTMIVSSIVSLKVFFSGFNTGRKRYSDIENRCQVARDVKNVVFSMGK
jgi:hypothetical protein